MEYGPGTNRAILAADQGIVDFYRSLIPKYVEHRPQMYPAHISVVRRITPPNLAVWGKYAGELVEFEYDSDIQNDQTYFWLNCRSARLLEIRVELGLPPYPTWRNGYHISIGNCKKL